MDSAHCLGRKIVLAAIESDSMSTVAERFREGGHETSITALAVLGAAVLTALVVLWQMARTMARRDGQSYHSPRRLFQDLCRLHKLDFASRKLLWRLAKMRRLEHPAQLFLEPTWFDAANLPTPLQPFRAQLAELQQRLFTDGHASG